MAKKKKKQGAKFEMNAGLIILMSILFFGLIIAVSLFIGNRINPALIILGVILVGTLVLTTKMSLALTKFRNRKPTAKSYVPFFNEVTLMPKRSIAKAVQALLIFEIVMIAWIVLGTKIQAISIGNIAGMVAGGNNANIISAVYGQYFVALIGFLVLTVVRAIGYVNLDNYIFEKDRQLNDLGSVKKVLRNKGKERKGRAGVENIYKVTYFIPVIRYIGLGMMYTRLFKLVTLQGATDQSKKKRKAVTEEA